MYSFDVGSSKPRSTLSVAQSGVPLHLLTEDAPALAAAATAEEAAFPTAASAPRVTSKLKVRLFVLQVLLMFLAGQDIQSFQMCSVPRSSPTVCISVGPSISMYYHPIHTVGFTCTL